MFVRFIFCDILNLSIQKSTSHCNYTVVTEICLLLKITLSIHKCLWEGQETVGFQSMLSEFPTNTIVTRTKHGRNITYFVGMCHI